MYKTLISLAILTSTTVCADSAIYRVQLAGWGSTSSTPDSGIYCGLLTGDNRDGLIMTGGLENRTIKKIESYNSGGWNFLHTAPFPVTGISGDNQSGPVIAGGYSARSVAYMNSYSANQWVTLPQAPFDIEGISGDNRKGPIIFNGNKLAILESYSNPKWKVLNHAPFPGGFIRGITGDNRNGVIAFNSNNDVVYINDYSSGVWTYVQPLPSPLPIEGITGSLDSGIIVSTAVGELWSMHFYRQSDGSVIAGSWYEVQTERINVSSIRLTGDVRNGFAYCEI